MGLLLLSFSLIFDPIANYKMHAIYVSVLEIEQPIGEKGGTINVKIFADDLEDAIFNMSRKRINLLTDECFKNKDLVNIYFAQHLQISIDGKKLEYYYSSCEINDISIWFNYSFISEPNWSELEVKADYLMDLFPAQSNVVSITKGKEKKMFRLTNQHTTQSLLFSK
jgi:hypothetical protein